MRRRRMLSLAGAAVGLAGCSGRSSTPTPTHAPPASPTGSPPDIDSYGCPPSAPDRTGAVCSHTVDRDAATVSLLPSDPTAPTPESLDLTLYNESATDLAFNPHSWTVMREGPSGWERLARQGQGDGRLVVGAGTTHTWSFAEVVAAIDSEAAPEPGTYTAEISVPDPGGSDWLACVALFRLV